MAHAIPWAQDEAELVTELQAGSDAAFDWLVTHYHGPVYSLVFGVLGESSDAADVTQEVFLKAFRGIRGFRRGSSLKTWLYRIAIREALNQRRWWRRHWRHQTSIDTGVDGSEGPLSLEDLRATPFDELATREVQAVVHQALRAVPAAFRSAVILRDLEGLSYEEVAEVLDVSVGTVKSRILRGRRALREVLEPLLAPAKRAVTATELPAAAPASTCASSNRAKRQGRVPRGLGQRIPVYAARDNQSATLPGARRSARGPMQAGSPGGGAR